MSTPVVVHPKHTTTRPPLPPCTQTSCMPFVHASRACRIAPPPVAASLESPPPTHTRPKGQSNPHAACAAPLCLHERSERTTHMHTRNTRTHARTHARTRTSRVGNSRARCATRAPRSKQRVRNASCWVPLQASCLHAGPVSTNTRQQATDRVPGQHHMGHQCMCNTHTHTAPHAAAASSDARAQAVPCWCCRRCWCCLPRHPALRTTQTRVVVRTLQQPPPSVPGAGRAAACELFNPKP
jgi:hypothetical protein